MSEWKEVKFKDIVHSMQLGTNALGKKENVGVPLLKMGNLTIGGFNLETFERLEELPYGKLKPYLLNKGDFLFNTRNTLELVGKSAVWNNQLPTATFNSNVMRIKFKEGADDFFIGYYFSSHDGWNEFKKISTGTTSVAAIYSRDLLKCQLNLPPLPTQRKIARILSTIDGQIEKTEAIIAKYQAVKQGMLQDLFTRGIDVRTGQLRPRYEDAPDLYQESPLGMIPKEWAVVRLKDVCLQIVDCPHSTPTYQDNGVLVARTMHIKKGIYNVALSSRVPSEEYEERVSRLEPQEGDLIFTREAPVGEAFVIPKGMRICLGQRVMLLRPNTNRCLSEFLLETIYSPEMQLRLDNMVGGTTAHHVNVADIKNLLLKMPSLTEQEMMVSLFQTDRRKMQKEMESLSKLQLLKQGMMQDLLSGKVAVNP